MERQTQFNIAYLVFAALAVLLVQPEGAKQIVVANRVEPEVAERIAKYGVPYTRNYESTLLRDLLSWIVPALVPARARSAHSGLAAR
jgi:hypothetical protein